VSVGSISHWAAAWAGTISIPGVYTGLVDKIPMGQA
jgi:hypothetical protein